MKAFDAIIEFIHTLKRISPVSEPVQSILVHKDVFYQLSTDLRLDTVGYETPDRLTPRITFAIVNGTKIQSAPEPQKDSLPLDFAYVYESLEGLRVTKTDRGLKFSIDGHYCELNGMEAWDLIGRLIPHAQSKPPKPNARRVRTDFEVARDILLLIDKALDYQTWRGWTDKQVEDACDYAGNEHLAASDNDIESDPRVPPHVLALPHVN